MAWRHNSVAPAIQSIFARDAKYGTNPEAGQGLVDLPFAIRSFASELAASAGKDFRNSLLDLIGPPRVVEVGNTAKAFCDHGESPDASPIDTARLRAVLELAAQKAGWGRAPPRGRGLGLAVHRGFGSYVAVAIEASVDANGDIATPRVDVAIYCGPTVNADRVRAQIKGAVVMGLGIALTSEISLKNGRVQQSNFGDYQAPRVNAAPAETRVHIAAHGFEVLLGGVGELGVPPTAPALLNAFFAATGERIRTLPVGRQLTKA